MSHLDRKVRNCMTHVKTLIHEHQTIDEAISILRERHIFQKVLYFYVIDGDGHLKGFVSTRDLLLKNPKMHIKDICQGNVISIHEDQSVHDAMQVMETQRLLALPVVDQDNKLIGAVDVSMYIEQANDVANINERKQIFQLMGLMLEEGKHRSIWHSYSMRMPWILCNIMGGIACAAISRMFEFVIQEVLILAMFIPLVLSLSESISMQSMTQSMHAKHKIFSFKSIVRQFKLYVLLAFTCAMIVGAISILWHAETHHPPLIIGIGIFISIIISSFMGAFVPYVLHKLSMDPKVAAGPVVLMIADVMTTFIYFTVAVIFLA